MKNNRFTNTSLTQKLVIALFSITLTLSEHAAIAAPIDLPSKDASWLETLNYYRLSSGVDPVTENAAQSAAALKHSIYLAKSDPKYFTGKYVNPHSENPESPYYTPEGANSGTNLTSVGKESEAIDSWMQAPLHAIGLLRDNLKTTGYASVLNERTKSYHTGLDVINGLKGDRRKIITFPGNGSFTRLYKFTGESPDPRESCGKDWKEFRGLPIFASFLSTPPRDITGSVVTPSGTTLTPGADLCIVSEHSWISTDPVINYGIDIVRGDHLVLVIPKTTLSAGQYSVTLTGSGMASLNWKFTVLLPPPAVVFRTDSAKEKISWDLVVGQDNNPIVGYTVVAWNRVDNTTKEYRATGDFLSTLDWPPGDYWVCVKARAQRTDGDCSIFYGYSIDRKPSDIVIHIPSYLNPKSVSWEIADPLGKDSQISSIRIQIRRMGQDDNLLSQVLPITAREFEIQSLSTGEYEVCILATNSYGSAGCYWNYFQVAPKVPQKFSKLGTTVVLGKSTYLSKLDTTKVNLVNLTPTICRIREDELRLEITGLKQGACNFEISAEEDAFLLPYRNAFSLLVIKDQRKTSTIRCTNGKTTKYVTGLNPSCPSGYRKTS